MIKNCVQVKDEYSPDRSMIDESDNTVIVCMDFVKGKCHRDNKCKYYHPEAHLIVSLISPPTHLYFLEEVGVLAKTANLRSAVFT